MRGKHSGDSARGVWRPKTQKVANLGIVIIVTMPKVVTKTPKRILAVALPFIEEIFREIVQSKEKLGKKWR